MTGNGIRWSENHTFGTPIFEPIVFDIRCLLKHLGVLNHS
jgi:hypothetical protein